MTSLTEALVGDVRTPLLVLLAAVASVLLIACANVASLMLARGVARSRELAVRAAVGATAARLLRQQLVESALLSLMGCGAGLALASWLLRIIQAAPGAAVPFLDRVALDTRVLAAALAMSLVCALVTGLLPAWNASRRPGAEALGSGSRATGTHVRVRQAIVFAQIAVATTTVAGGMLLSRSFARLTAVPPGFTADGTLLADVSLPAARYARDARAPFFDRALDRIRALPGVRAAALAGRWPRGRTDSCSRGR